MKNKFKLTVFFAIPIIFGCLIACKEQDKQIITKGEKVIAPEYPKVFTYHKDDVPSNTDAIVMASDGHEYLLYDNNGADEKFEHYWNCKTCKTYKK